MAKTIKVKFGIYVSDGGDGTVTPHIVEDEAYAARCVDRELEDYGQAFGEGGSDSTEVEIDVATGKIVSGLETMSDIFDDDDDA